MNDALMDSMIVSLNPVPSSELVGGPGMNPSAIAGIAHARRRRSRTLLAAPLLLAGALATAAAAVDLSGTSSAPSETINVACAAHVGGDVITGVIADSPDPVATCRAVWKAGQMIQGVTVAPALQACVADGRVTVYPSASACTALSEPPFSGYTDEQTVAITLNSSLRQLFADNACLAPSSAQTQINRLLAAKSITGWTVTTTGDSGCAGFRLDLGSHTIAVAD